MAGGGRVSGEEGCRATLFEGVGGGGRSEQGVGEALRLEGFCVVRGGGRGRDGGGWGGGGGCT